MCILPLCLIGRGYSVHALMWGVTFMLGHGDRCYLTSVYSHLTVLVTCVACVVWLVSETVTLETRVSLPGGAATLAILACMLGHSHSA
mgnify:CR=1 FL=1